MSRPIPAGVNDAKRDSINVLNKNLEVVNGGGWGSFKTTENEEKAIQNCYHVRKIYDMPCSQKDKIMHVNSMISPKSTNPNIKRSTSSENENQYYSTSLVKKSV
jgi:hypothetical protein